MSQVFRGSSSSRVVLTGEHSVVYGYPAITASLPLETVVELGEDVTPLSADAYPLGVSEFVATILPWLGEYLKIEGSVLEKLQYTITSNIPARAGLASSTALINALAQALLRVKGTTLSQSEVLEGVTLAESQIYPVSGMDQAAVVVGGWLRHQRSSLDKPVTWQKLAVSKPFSLVVINTGTATESTAEMVARVRESLETQPELKKTLSELGELAGHWESALIQDKVPLELVRENHRALVKLGVVGRFTQDLITEIETTGGAAKISGAGGVQTGSGAVLAWHEDLSTLETLAQKHQLWYHQVTL